MTAETGSEQQVRDCAEQVLEQAQQQGATAAEVWVDRGEGLSAQVRMGELETIERDRDQGLIVRAYFDTQRGSASSTDLRTDSISETVRAACRIARHTESDPCQGLPERERLAWDSPDLDLDHPWQLDGKQAANLATECEEAARKDPRIVNSEGARVQTYRGTHLVGNSLGFVGSYSDSSHTVSCCVVAADEQGTMVRDYWYSCHNNWRSLQDIQQIGQHAAERALRRLGSRSLASETVPVLFEAPVARSLISHFVQAASGPALYQKASFLLGKEGKTVWSPGIHLIERPRIRGGQSSAPFDGEGIATGERTIVQDGVLQGWFLNSYAARRLGLESTGNAGGVRNLSLETEAPTLSEPELLSRMGRGLWVTELMGQGANTVTGDYSIGAAGFWVEAGAVAFPVNEITIAGSLLEMYRGIEAMGSEVDQRGSIQTGALLIDRMRVAGTGAPE